jgi:hypothetical protein
LSWSLSDFNQLIFSVLCSHKSWAGIFRPTNFFGLFNWALDSLGSERMHSRNLLIGLTQRWSRMERILKK